MKQVCLGIILVGMLAGAGCSSVYYSAMEKLGYAKRDLLVERVDDTRKAQGAAKKQFTSALDHFLAVVKVEGSQLQDKYDELNSDYERSKNAAHEVHERIAAVEDVAGALFSEWNQELSQYSNPKLRRDSQRQLDATHHRYDELLRLMHQTADRMDPVLATFHDQVLFLKHNLNAQAIASLDTTTSALQSDVTHLIADMDASIHESETFVHTLKAQ